MGCYYSKEISELVLGYSEYKYQLITRRKCLKTLRRYADDGLMIFSTSDEKYIINELQKLMLFYPANLVINVVLNRVACNYLDLNLQLDDISEKYRKLHFTIFHKNTNFISFHI